MAKPFHKIAPPECGAFFCSSRRARAPGFRLFHLLAILLYVGLWSPQAYAVQSEALRIGPYLIGETLYYAVTWGPLRVGSGTFETTLQEEEGVPFIRLRFTSVSEGIADKLYQVQDCIDAYIHPETLQPVRVVKKTQEGDFLCDSTLHFNHDTLQMTWEDRQGDQTVHYNLGSQATDFYSLLYRLRSMDFSEGTNQVQVAVDNKLHALNVSAGESRDLKIEGRGKVACRNIRVDPVTEGLFVRKIPSEVWVTKDEPRVLASMKIKVPVGSVKVKFERREVQPLEEMP